MAAQIESAAERNARLYELEMQRMAAKE